MRTCLQIIGHAWASPNTILGLALGGAGRSQVQRHQGAIEILMETGPVLKLCNRMGISAFTLGDCVLYAVTPCKNLRIHEGRHSRQYWVLGPFFLPIYFALMAIYGYYNHPLETDARATEISLCGCLYESQIPSK